MLVRFGDKNRRFAVVDVVAYPEVAEDLNINTGGTSKQLPTLALFTSGRYAFTGVFLFSVFSCRSIPLCHQQSTLMLRSSPVWLGGGSSAQLSAIFQMTMCFSMICFAEWMSSHLTTKYTVGMLSKVFTPLIYMVMECNRPEV